MKVTFVLDYRQTWSQEGNTSWQQGKRSKNSGVPKPPPLAGFNFCTAKFLDICIVGVKMLPSEYLNVQETNTYHQNLWTIDALNQIQGQN